MPAEPRAAVGAQGGKRKMILTEVEERLLHQAFLTLLGFAARRH
jgi:hypothetical protein